MEFITDCLVLKIEEFELYDKSKKDTTIYILYDQKDGHYVIRGKRRNIKNTIEAQTYSFNCKKANDLESFLSFVICRKNYWSLTLYNYDNLPYNSDNITYNFLQENASREYEVSGYDMLKYNKKGLKQNLKMLKNVFNNYN
jgi:hypothetical protein